MMHESENFPNSDLDSQKKFYSAMKVSKLGSLAALTQAMENGIYADAMGGSMVMMGMN